MPSNRTPLERDQAVQRQARAWELRQRGWTQFRIAKELGCNQGTVSRLLARVYKRALARLDKHAARERAVQVEQLNHVVDESLEAWERSKKPRKRSSRRTGGAGKGAGDATTIEAQERDGDPVFLSTAMQAMDRIRQLLALDVSIAKEDASGVDLRSALLAAEAADASYQADEPIPPEPPDACLDTAS